MQYEIRIDGLVPETLAEAFPELRRFVVPDQTVLVGQVTDEAHLYGLLTRCQSLGLHVVEMRRLAE
ncbi:hypothetical protein [Streptomyces aurantiogriseus]|uniref:Uncharacterized protein n=1 Tax=Streptomyces aurantiogriseus TaxID=66870 RepID=A0A918KXA9_9ACTN|nr:hypothetical protein [Streptomyces aurantiogriseus]GGR38911.1 hypothetical protein GCM10010251_64400 [Streptomyces aurantiogriseus]